MSRAEPRQSKTSPETASSYGIHLETPLLVYVIWHVIFESFFVIFPTELSNVDLLRRDLKVIGCDNFNIAIPAIVGKMQVFGFFKIKLSDVNDLLVAGC